MSPNQDPTTGRFVKGNTAARGQQPRLRRVMGKEASDDDMREIVRTAIKQAKKGDNRARTFLASYLIGKPRVAKRHGPRLDLGELRTATQCGQAAAEVARAAAAGEIDVDTARDLAALVSLASDTQRLGAIEEELEQLRAALAGKTVTGWN